MGEKVKNSSQECVRSCGHSGKVHQMKEGDGLQSHSGKQVMRKKDRLEIRTSRKSERGWEGTADPKGLHGACALRLPAHSQL